jgi:HEAT repeat protein
MMDSKNDDLSRSSACNAIWRIGGSDALGTLLELAKSDDSQCRRVVLDVLGGEVGNESKDTAPALAEALEDLDAGVRSSATEWLLHLGGTAVPFLEGMLARSSGHGRVYAALILMEMGKPLPEKTTSSAIECYNHRDPAVREKAIEVLRRVRFGSVGVFETIIKAMLDESSDVRWQAVSAATENDELARIAVPFLLNSIKDESSAVRWRSAEALGRSGAGSDNVAAALVDALADPESDVRLFAASALGNLGQQSTAVVSALKKCASEDDSEEVRDAARDALSALS